MRLSLFEVEKIIASKNKVFGNDAKIYLFGSRVDDQSKGGDIDLYVEIQSTQNLLEKKIAFLTLVQNYLGEQKIDIVFAKDASRAIEMEAKSKGIELDLEKIKLQKYFDECDKHLQRIEEAYSDIEKSLPLLAHKYIHLTKDEVQAIDQYLFRFAKFQDTLGDKIFKLLVAQYESSSEVLPFIDILNKLEKIGFIDNAKEWNNLRKIRNEISHQYDNEPEEMSQAINSILGQKDVIKEIYLKIKLKYKNLLKN
jgi:predicted nucleotidyltransferase